VFDFYKMSSEDVMGKGPTKGSKRKDEMVGCEIRVRRQELLCSFSARGKKGRRERKDTVEGTRGAELMRYTTNERAMKSTKGAKRSANNSRADERRNKLKKIAEPRGTSYRSAVSLAGEQSSRLEL
jgi:hypothetical protein